MKRFIYRLKLRYHSHWLANHWRCVDPEKWECHFALWVHYADLLDL